MKAAVTLSLMPLALLLAAAPPAEVAAQTPTSAAAQRQTGESAYDGIYGPMTADRVRRFQRAHGLKADGLAGPATLRALRLPATATLKPGMTGPAVARLQAALARRGFWTLPSPTARVPALVPFPVPELPMEAPLPTDEDTWITPAPLYTDQPPAPATPEPYADWEATPSPTPSPAEAPEALRPTTPEPTEVPRFVRFGGGAWYHQGTLTPLVRAEFGQGLWVARLAATFLPGTNPILGTTSTAQMTTTDLHLGFHLGEGTLLVGTRIPDLFAPTTAYGSFGFRIGGPLWGRSLGWGVFGLAGLDPATRYFVDGLAALEAHVGPFGINGGWRFLGQHQLTAPGTLSPVTYSGPQLGLTLQF